MRVSERVRDTNGLGLGEGLPEGCGLVGGRGCGRGAVPGGEGGGGLGKGAADAVVRVGRVAPRVERLREREREVDAHAQLAQRIGVLRLRAALRRSVETRARLGVAPQALERHSLAEQHLHCVCVCVCANQPW